MSTQFFCGVDLAKHHFSLHAVDDNGKVILHKSVSRAKLLATLANMPTMCIGIEAGRDRERFLTKKDRFDDHLWL